MSPSLTNTLNEAISKGILPPAVRDYTHADDLDRQPAGMNLLSFIGAQLAVIPLLLFIGAVSDGLLLKAAWPFIIGAICLGTAIMGLRHIAALGFLSHMAFSVLWVGDGLLTDRRAHV